MGTQNGYNGDMDATEFKLRLKRSGQTRQDAAENLGVSLDTVHAYCKGKRSVTGEIAAKVAKWVQHVTGSSPSVPIVVAEVGDIAPIPAVETVAAVPKDDPYKDDWETGFRPITEEYVRSLGYGSAYKGDDWFERGKRAVLSSRQLGETSGRVKHERWGK